MREKLPVIAADIKNAAFRRDDFRNQLPVNADVAFGLEFCCLVHDTRPRLLALDCRKPSMVFSISGVSSRKAS